MVLPPSQLWQFITPWDHDLNKLAFTLPEHDSTQVSTFQPINLEKNIVKHFFPIHMLKFTSLLRSHPYLGNHVLNKLEFILPQDNYQQVLAILAK